MNEEVLSIFICGGDYMVIVKLEHGVHVMPMKEWKSVYGRLHPERWKVPKRKKTA